MRIRTWICLFAGAMDGLTGLGLVADPQLTLSLMSVGGVATGEALPFMRFLGAFVFGVGSLYLLTWRWEIRGRTQASDAVWVGTGWIRLCVGLTTLGLLVLGELELAWLSVPLVDLALGGYQLGSVWREGKRR